MRVLSTKEAVDNAIRVLLHSGEQVRSDRWQGVPRPADKNIGRHNHMIEVCDLFFKMHMCTMQSLSAKFTGADIPWAEAHFAERLAGPSNPGETYKFWPYATDYTDYLKDGKFSHTYQERFWPTEGNWDDIVSRLSTDISTRQSFFAIWHPEDQINNGVRVPCTIGYWFKVTKGKLNVTYLIRSCDARRHLRNDIYMTQRLAQEMIQRLKASGILVDLGIMSMWIGSLHCFESDVYELRKRTR